MFFLLFLLYSAAMAQLSAIVYNTNTPECVNGDTEIWVNEEGDGCFGKITRAEANDFTTTQLEVTGTLMINGVTLEEYIQNVIDSHTRL